MTDKVKLEKAHLTALEKIYSTANTAGPLGDRGYARVLSTLLETGLSADIKTIGLLAKLPPSIPGQVEFTVQPGSYDILNHGVESFRYALTDQEYAMMDELVRTIIGVEASLPHRRAQILPRRNYLLPARPPRLATNY